MYCPICEDEVEADSFQEHKVGFHGELYPCPWCSAMVPDPKEHAKRTHPDTVPWLNGMEFEGDEEMKLRAYRMYKNGELDASQARRLFGDEFSKVERMIRNDKIIDDTPDIDPTNDDLFF